MDGHSGVNDTRLNRFLFHDGLDGLVDVVMHVLTSNGGHGALRVRRRVDDLLVLEAGLVGQERGLCAFMVAVVEFAVLGRDYIGSVLLGQDLAVLDGLDRAVVVVLVDFFVNRGVDFFVLGGLDGLVLDGRRNCLVYSCVVAAGSGGEVLDGLFHLIHVDDLLDVSRSWVCTEQ
jgi:hypothetical protein